MGLPIKCSYLPCCKGDPLNLMCFERLFFYSHFYFLTEIVAICNNAAVFHVSHFDVIPMTGSNGFKKKHKMW